MPTNPHVAVLCLLAIIMTSAISDRLAAEGLLDQEPIVYDSPQTDDPIARLQRRLEQRELQLAYDDEHGYLPALLKHLNVPVSSQTLVFSKTSFQRNLISPQTPRALYFNENVYIGAVQQGDVLEFSAVDPQKGAIFYTLDQQAAAQPRFVRQTHRCTICHASSQTRDVPGQVLRSVFPDKTGMPIFSSGTFVTEQTSPFKERWGGWYVTGTHGSQRHMGNVVATDSNSDSLDVEAGANVTDLSAHFDVSRYLSPHSDIVALLVLEHQAPMHNLITAANYQARLALRDQALLNEIEKLPPQHLRPSTERRLASAGEKLLRYMLMVEEEQLTAPVQGSSSFAADFARQGPRDSHGRSLCDLDLHRRVFKFPCSYLIYSEAFEALPTAMKDYLYRRLWEILTGRDESEDYAPLSQAERQAILEILVETKAGLPDYWIPGGS